MQLQYIDGHCHADLLLERDANYPEEYRKRRIGGISWSFPEDIASWREYPAYWDRLLSMAKSLKDEDLSFYYLVGIHPRCIPDDLRAGDELPSELIEALDRHMHEPLCLGFGEIGLEKATDLEGWILRRQLDYAVCMLPEAKRIGVHTPRADKARITRDILALFGEYDSLKGKVLIDHVSPATYSMVRREGFDPVGMTLQPGKTSVEELAEFIREDRSRIESVVLGSDGARQLSSEFFRFLDHRDVLEDEERRRLLLDNAREFWGIKG